MNRSAPTVSAITPVFNGERFLSAAIDSALAQDYDDFEIVVLDDGSIDRSAEIARAYAAAHPQRVRYVHQDNGGICKARNMAIKHARGRYVALLDCDDLWMPQHLSRSVAALDAVPGTALVHADVRFIDDDGAIIQEFLGQQRWSRWAHDPFTAILLRYEHVACATTVFPRALALQIGGFDLRYTGLGCEDRDLWLRLALHGKVTCLGHHGADYRVHDGGFSRQFDRMQRGRRLLVERMTEFPEGRRLHGAALSALALSVAEECALEGRYGGVLRAYGNAIRLNPYDPRGWRGLARALVTYRGRMQAQCT